MSGIMIYPIGTSASSIGEKLRKARTAQGLSQEDLSIRSGVSRRTIQRIEKGHRANLVHINALAKALNVALRKIIGIPIKKTLMNPRIASGYEISPLDEEFPKQISFADDVYAVEIETPIEMELIKSGWILILSPSSPIKPGDLVLNYGNVGPQFVMTGVLPLAGESHKVVWIKTK